MNTYKTSQQDKYVGPRLSKLDFRSVARNLKLNVELSKDLDAETREMLGRLSHPNKSGGSFLTIN